LPDTTQCNYEGLTALLQSAGADSCASEAQGMLSGTICAAGKTVPGLWLEYLLGEDNTLSAAAGDCSNMFLTLQSELLRQLNDEALGFELFLPLDDVSLSLRTEALSRWCAGFLYGLALGGFREDAEIPDNVNEVMKDIYEISRAKFSYDTTGEADETAYMEIMEYVRISVLLLYEELQPVPTTRLQ
jgi:yecA family protein